MLDPVQPLEYETGLFELLLLRAARLGTLILSPSLCYSLGPTTDLKKRLDRASIV